MECLRGFLLQLVVLDCGIFRRKNLRHRVGEIHHTVRSGVMLDHRRLRACFGHDQVAWRDCRVRFGRDEQQVHRLFQHHAACQMQISAIGHKGGIQRTEYGLALVIAQIRFKYVRRFFKCIGQTAERHAGRQRTRCRQRRGMTAIMKNQQVSGAVVQRLAFD